MRASHQFGSFQKEDFIVSCAAILNILPNVIVIKYTRSRIVMKLYFTIHICRPILMIRLTCHGEHYIKTLLRHPLFLVSAGSAMCATGDYKQKVAASKAMIMVGSGLHHYD